MTEGWDEDDYWMLFERDEAVSLGERYGLGTALPGLALVGLKGWDDFVVRDSGGGLFTVPTVPLDGEYLALLAAVPEAAALKQDSRFGGKIKWYIKPVAFGGDPVDQANMKWITLDQHVELVKWFNDLYRQLKAR